MSLKEAGRLPAIPARLQNIPHSTTRKRRTRFRTDITAAPATLPTSLHGSFSIPPFAVLPTPTSSVSEFSLGTPLSTSPSDYPTVFLLIFLRYAGQMWSVNESKELKGTANDLELCLRTFNYRHSPGNRFEIISDIDLTFTDGEGIECQIKGEHPSRENIKRAIMSIARQLTPKDNCLIWYGGHALKSPDEGSPQYGSLLSLDGESIYGWELRDWLTNGIDRRTPITLVLDACYSANLLGLPISYVETDGIIEVRGESSARKDTNLTLIAAAGEDQYASSASGMNPQNTKLYGVLTWVLLAIMSNPNHGGTMDRIKWLYTKVPEYSRKYSGQQQGPHVTTSLKPLNGELAIFNIPGLTIAPDTTVVGGRRSVLRLMFIRLWLLALSLVDHPPRVPRRAAVSYLWSLL